MNKFEITASQVTLCKVGLSGKKLQEALKEMNKYLNKRTKEE